jgi:hypothetical protein
MCYRRLLQHKQNNGFWFFSYRRLLQHKQDNGFWFFSYHRFTQHKPDMFVFIGTSLSFIAMLLFKA